MFVFACVRMCVREVCWLGINGWRRFLEKRRKCALCRAAPGRCCTFSTTRQDDITACYQEANLDRLPDRPSSQPAEQRLNCRQGRRGKEIQKMLLCFRPS